jgi:midasin
LRWCKLLTNEKTGFEAKWLDGDKSLLRDFMLVLFEKMKLVYCQRMRSESDVTAILNIFGNVFECVTEALNQESKAVSFYWNDTDVYLSDIQWFRVEGADDKFNSATHKHSIILSSQVESLKNVVECVMMEKPVILAAQATAENQKSSTPSARSSTRIFTSTPSTIPSHEASSSLTSTECSKTCGSRSK